MNTEREILVDTSFSFDNTGFNLDSQMEMISSSKETLDLEEWKSKTKEKNRSDLEGLYWEYMVQSDILPFELSFQNNRVVCPQYGNKPLSDVVSETERDGTIKNSIQQVEQLLLTGQDGDTHLLISPPGWSGFGHDHPTMQIYYYQKNGSEIRSMTIIDRSKGLENSEALRETLTGKNWSSLKNEREKIIEFTSQIHSFRYLEPHDIIYTLERVSKQDLSHMYDLVNNFPTIDAKVSSCISELEDFIDNEVSDTSDISLYKLRLKLGQTVLDMKSVLTRGRKPNTVEEYTQSYTDFARDEGCNGGGTIYGRGIETTDEEFPLWGLCRLGAFCLSNQKGHDQPLGLCMICKTCDRAFRNGKTFGDIKAMNTTQKDESIQTENIPLSPFALAAYSFLSSLF